MASSTLSPAGQVIAQSNPPGVSVMPSPAAPISQGASGNITPVWWAFLQTLYQKVGSNTNLNLGAIPGSIAAVGVVASGAQIAAAEAQSSASAATSLALEGIYTENAGSGVGYSRTINATGDLSFQLNADGNIDLSSSGGSGGIIAVVQGTTSPATFTTLSNDGSVIFSSTTVDDLTLSTGQIILQDSTFSQNATIPSNRNGYTLGTPTIASGATVVIEPGATWFINQSFATGSAASGTIGIEVGGTLFPTLHTGPNITFGGTSPDLTISSSGGSIGVEYAGTLYPTLAAGANTTLTPSGSTLTVSASGGGSGSSGLFSGVLASQPTNPPTTASMAFNTWGNQLSAVFANGLQGVLFYDNTVEGANISYIKKAAPSTPFIATVGIIPNLVGANDQFNIGFVDGSGKLQWINITSGPGNNQTIFVQQWNSTTSFNANPATLSLYGGVSVIFLRVTNDGTNIGFWYSLNGEIFTELYSTTIGGGFLSSYNELILGLNAQSKPASSSIFYYND